MGHSLRTSLLLAALSTLLVGCGDDGPPASEESGSTQALAVAAHRVTAEEIRRESTWHGTARPAQELTLKAPRSGQVTRVQVARGDAVEAGDEILRIAEPELAARIDVLSQREERLREEVQRWESLQEIQAAGPAEVNQARLQLLEVQETLSSLQASRAPSVRAPVAGRVIAIHAPSGSHVQPGEVLVEIAEATPMIELSLSPTDAATLVGARDLRITSGEDTFELLQVVTTTGEAGMIGAQIYIDASDDALMKPFTIRAVETHDALLIPWTALATEDAVPWVGLLKGDPPEVTRTDVELGRSHRDGVEVLDGLSEGAVILRYDPRSVAEGRTVEPVEREGDR